MGRKSRQAGQLVLDLPLRPALGAEDFIVSDSNREAVRMIDAWPAWPAPALVLAGPAGSGKTHLANVWRLRLEAALAEAADIDEESATRLAGGRGAVIENADRAIGSERALFHLMNLAREHGFNLLITGRTPPGEWSVALPDLRSRLRAAPVIRIAAPDESLLANVLVKLLYDRQLAATPAAISYLARHMERSMEAAIRVVDAIDRQLWSAPGEITREVARRALAELAGSEGEA